MLIGPDGTAWFAGSHGIAHYRDGKFDPVVIPDEAMPLGTGNQVFAVDSHGVVYALLFKGGIVRVDSSHPAATRILGEAEGIKEIAVGIVCGPDDAIWFTYGSHLGHLPAGTNKIEVDPGIKVPKERVVALLFDGLASAPASFRFRVLPNFWQTRWARASGMILALVCLWGFVSLRTRALNRRRLELELAVAQRSAELLQKNKELEEISLTDPLTTTRNRRYFYETISTDIAQALRSHLKSVDPRATPGPRQELIFVLVDIDRFKRVNDELGHAAGDRLLQEVAKRITSVMRRSDDLVRWGGEEFLLACRTTDRENASMLCNRVLEAIRDLPFDVGNGVQVRKTCSIGWAPFPWMQDDVGLLSIDNVIELADRALYLAKREGRNRSFGMLPAPDIEKSEKTVSMENLRDCPPDLVQIV